MIQLYADSNGENHYLLTKRLIGTEKKQFYTILLVVKS